jgi:hypothetical protein
MGNQTPSQPGLAVPPRLTLSLALPIGDHDGHAASHRQQTARAERYRDNLALAFADQPCRFCIQGGLIGEVLSHQPPNSRMLGVLCKVSVVAGTEQESSHAWRPLNERIRHGRQVMNLVAASEDDEIIPAMRHLCICLAQKQASNALVALFIGPISEEQVLPVSTRSQSRS